jgi:putative transposase
MWVHLLFSTKNCYPLIDPSVRDEIYAHMRAQLIESGCTPKIISGMPDHVHLIFLYDHTLGMSDIVKQLKGNTSHWINDHDLSGPKFVWEKAFYSFSENVISLPWAIEHLKNQEEYHRTKSYLHEAEELIAMYGGSLREEKVKEVLTATAS